MDTENHSFPTPQPGAKPKLEPGPLQMLKLLKKKKLFLEEVNKECASKNMQKY